MPRHEIDYIKVNRMQTPVGLFIEVVIGNLARQLSPASAIKLADLIYEATDDE